MTAILASVADFRVILVNSMPCGLANGITSWLKSILPISRPMGGMMMSLTMEDTILPKAPPMITATARSSTLPRRANSLNSLNMVFILLKNYLME